METAVHALVATLHRSRVNLGEAGNLFGDDVIPEFPTEAFGKPGSDGTAAAAVLALNGDEAEHGCRLVYRYSPCGLRFFHQEDHRNHAQNRHTEKPETVHIGQHGGLAENHALD